MPHLPHHIPAALDLRGRRGQVKVLRAVATFEVSKGLVVLAAACGIMFLIHQDADTWEVAFNLLRLLHISPDHHFARVFLEWADNLTDKKLWAIATVALAYSALRFIEAYGLWKARVWAEWVALISGALYVPIEIRELIRRPNLFHTTLLVANLAIVFYMVYLRFVYENGIESETPPGS